MTEKSKKRLVITAFALFSIILIGIFYLFTTPGQTANVAFAYVVGLSMIVLPCTLPLAFVIVPMAMGKGPKKGLIMALLFGLGLAITLSMYGLFVAIVGKSLGLNQAIGGAGTVSRILFIIGGLAAFIFGLSELNLINFRMPTYKGSYPAFITKQGDYLKAFFLGLFLGNAGVGCPNPLFYVLLGDIAVTGNLLTGWWLGFVHGIGRATPLIFLAILGILGVNAVGNIAKKTAVVTKWTGISLVILGAVIFIMGTSHHWYENSLVHREWNQALQIVVGSSEAEKGAPAKIATTTNTTTNKVAPATNTSAEKSPPAKENPDFIPAPWSWITLLLMIIIPLVWYRYRSKLKKAN